MCLTKVKDKWVISKRYGLLVLEETFHNDREFFSLTWSDLIACRVKEVWWDLSVDEANESDS